MKFLKAGFLSIIGLFMLSTMAQAHEGSVHIVSAYDVPTTVERLKQAIEAKGATIFATVDHAAGAKKVGLELDPTVLVIFGNPKIGTILIQSHRMKGLDVPLRMLVAKEDGVVRVNYNDPQKMCQINANDAAKATCNKIEKVMNALAHEAAGQ